MVGRVSVTIAPMPLRIRAARPGDLPQIYDVLGAAFDAPIELFIDQTERDSTFRWSHARVAEVDEQIVAHVRIFARRMLVRGVSLKAGGIGSVATLPSQEGRGLATALLYDAVQQMHRMDVAVAYLYTGIPWFYERVGFHTVNQPGFVASAAEAAAIERDVGYKLRRISDGDIVGLLRLYRRATRGRTGAVARSEQTWRDARAWLNEDGAGCLIAEHDGRLVAYVRSRRDRQDYQILEAEHEREHERAVRPLLRAVGQRASRLGLPIFSFAPGDSTLAATLRDLPSTTWSSGRDHVPHPMMMRIVSLDRLLESLLPLIRERAAEYAGPPFALTLHAPDGESATLAVAKSSASLRRKTGDCALAEASTLAVILGQKHASKLLRPRPPREVARRLDAIFPETALHFWNSDRI